MTSESELPVQPRGTRRVRSVDHAIDVLEIVHKANRPLGVSDIARRANLSKAAIHHILITLEHRQFVMRDPDSAKYRLGWGLYELGFSVVRDLDLSRAARPFLDRLAEQTDESVLLGILDEDTVLYVDRAEAPSGLRMAANAGRRGSLAATASGKVLLAHASEKETLSRILNEPLHRFTPTTITNPEKLRRQLADVRKRGYATCWEEREIGLCSLAVPLRDYTGLVVGSLAIAAPAGRLNESTATAHLAPLREAARQIEIRLGGASVANQSPALE